MKRLLYRVNNPLVLKALIDGNAPPELIGNQSGPEEWLSDPLNIALRINDDLGMFEHDGDGIYAAHCYCASRGKTAIEHTRAAITEMFERYGAKSIFTETPLEVPDALSGRRTLLFARMVGFVPVRETERPIGRVMLSVYKRERLPPSDCGIKDRRSLTA